MQIPFFSETAHPSESISMVTLLEHLSFCRQAAKLWFGGFASIREEAATLKKVWYEQLDAVSALQNSVVDACGKCSDALEEEQSRASALQDSVRALEAELEQSSAKAKEHEEEVRVSCDLVSITTSLSEMR